MQFKRNYFRLITSMLLLASIGAFAQVGNPSNKIHVETVELTAANWDFKPETVEFSKLGSKQSMKLLTGELTVAKDIDFINGTIEFDIQPQDRRFTSFHFRWEDEQKNECFYFRTQRAGNPSAIDAIQYTPYIHGVNMWNMYPQYQSNADFKTNEWNHVKLVVSGKRLRVYVNNMLQPSLEVPMLEADVKSGSLAFRGVGIISNIVIKHNETENLCPGEGVDITSNDSRYIRNWKVSRPVTAEKGIDISEGHYPDNETEWIDISSENYGLVNLTRMFGGSVDRRIVWLRTTIHSDREQEKAIRLGFNNEVWVYINDKPLYFDKNPYNTPMMKHPHGRCSIENTTIKVPLKEGENHLLIGVANYFFGWGIIARFDSNDGIRLE